MQTINIFISKAKITKVNAATTNQIKYLSSLCVNRDMVFPFEDLQQAKSHIKKNEANRAIKELLAGNSIVFIYPTPLD